jgi:hypothetical protein
MVLWILLHQINFEMFLMGCCEKDCPRNIYSDRYIFDNGDSYSRLSSNADQAVQLFFSWILILFLLLMLVITLVDASNMIALPLRLKV